MVEKKSYSIVRERKETEKNNLISQFFFYKIYSSFVSDIIRERCFFFILENKIYFHFYSKFLKDCSCIFFSTN